jgi:hypothetical protein
MIWKYWAVFNNHGVFVPVKNYECKINTGDSPPITVKKNLYGAKELPLMHKAVAGFEKLATFAKFTMDGGCSKQFLPQSHIRSMSNTSTILSGGSASTTYRSTQ